LRRQPDADRDEHHAQDRSVRTRSAVEVSPRRHYAMRRRLADDRV